MSQTAVQGMRQSVSRHEIYTYEREVVRNVTRMIL